jgi:hypothetical protein
MRAWDSVSSIARDLVVSFRYQCIEPYVSAS